MSALWQEAQFAKNSCSPFLASCALNPETNRTENKKTEKLQTKFLNIMCVKVLSKNNFYDCWQIYNVALHFQNVYVSTKLFRPYLNKGTLTQVNRFSTFYYKYSNYRAFDKNKKLSQNIDKYHLHETLNLLIGQIVFGRNSSIMLTNL